MTNIKVTPPKNLNNIHEFEEYKPEWIDLSSLTPAVQPWIWPGVIPNETSTLLAGYGGVGKSMFLTFIASYISTGKEFNCCGERVILPKGSVILLSAEDREDTSILPNLLACEADISKIHPIKSVIATKSGKRKFLDLDKQLYILENKILQLKDLGQEVKLISYDPISYFMGETRDHIHTEVSNFIQSINDLSRKYSFGSLLNKHMRKKSGHQSLATIVDEVGGSAAWINTPRQNFAFIRHPKDKEKILIFNMKTNITKQQKEALCYKIEQVVFQINNKFICGNKLVWMDKKESSGIESVLNEDVFDKSKSRQANEIIYDYLYENGVTSSNILKSECLKYGISERTCQRTWAEMEKYKTIRRVKGNIKTCFELTEGWKGDE